jgi:hypothetical protein
MKLTQALFVATVVAVTFPACASSGWSSMDALVAESVEMQVTDLGQMAEVEYHIRPDQVPAVVRQSMDKLHPGGPYTGAEKEYEGGSLFYELTRPVGGMEIEAMFTPEGKLHSEEIEVSQNKVPTVVQNRAKNAIAGATITKWEEIRDGEQLLREYHVKMTKGGMKYKVMITPTGRLVAVYREIPAEIEVRQP